MRENGNLNHLYLNFDKQPILYWIELNLNNKCQTFKFSFYKIGLNIKDVYIDLFITKT